uniref:Uncharacterized protein n=1 Tax=Oryza barthii TaxID=65489 RepID=A0A0D3HDG5_9ORYZ
MGLSGSRVGRTRAGQPIAMRPKQTEGSSIQAAASVTPGGIERSFGLGGAEAPGGGGDLGGRMELMGEYCNNAPCKWLLDLGKGGAHDTNAHNLFDGMPSQSEMPKEDQRTSKPVPINSTMNKEEKWLDKALDRILEKFEQMEAKRMQEEKINQIFQKLEEIEVRRSKASEEIIEAIRATTAVLKAKSPTAPIAPPTPAPTKCLTECPNNNFTWATTSSSHIGEDTAPTATWELGDNKDKGHAPCIVAKDSPEVTPTMCSTKCSGGIERSFGLGRAEAPGGGGDLGGRVSRKQKYTTAALALGDVNHEIRRPLISYVACIWKANTCLHGNLGNQKARQLRMKISCHEQREEQGMSSATLRYTEPSTPGCRGSDNPPSTNATESLSERRCAPCYNATNSANSSAHAASPTPAFDFNGI